MINSLNAAIKELKQQYKLALNNTHNRFVESIMKEAENIAVDPNLFPKGFGMKKTETREGKKVVKTNLKKTLKKLFKL